MSIYRVFLFVYCSVSLRTMLFTLGHDQEPQTRPRRRQQTVGSDTVAQVLRLLRRLITCAKTGPTREQRARG